MDRLEAAARTRKLSEDSQEVMKDYLESFLRQREMSREKSGTMDEYLSTLRKEMAELVVQNIQLMDKLMEVNGTIEYLKTRKTNIRNFAVCYTDSNSVFNTPQPSPRVSKLMAPSGDCEGAHVCTSNLVDEGFCKEDNALSTFQSELTKFLKEFEIDWSDEVWKKDTIKSMSDPELEDSGIETASNDGLEVISWVDGFASAKTSTL